jgi:hypothetical protein
LCRAILAHDDVAIVVDIDRCGGYGGCCGMRRGIGSGAGSPAVGDLLGLMQGMELLFLLMNPHANLPELIVFVWDAVDACGHGLQD